MSGFTPEELARIRDPLLTGFRVHVFQVFGGPENLQVIFRSAGDGSIELAVTPRDAVKLAALDLHTEYESEGGHYFVRYDWTQRTDALFEVRLRMGRKEWVMYFEHQVWMSVIARIGGWGRAVAEEAAAAAVGGSN